jgi:hypothetical protein
MPDDKDNDIETERMALPDVNDEDSDPRAAAYRIAVWVMEEFQPGFVLIGSPAMGETQAGYMYPDSVGIVINNEVELTPTGLAEVLIELASQLNSQMDEVEEFVKGYNDGVE